MVRYSHQKLRIPLLLLVFDHCDRPDHNATGRQYLQAIPVTTTAAAISARLEQAFVTAQVIKTVEDAEAARYTFELESKS